MKIYIASSWKNQVLVSKTANELRDQGHEAYDFTGDGFHWSYVDTDYKNWTTAKFIQGLNHPKAVSGFLKDKEALDWCDACIMLSPCGKSSHLELGYAAGKGKRTYILIVDGDPDLMYNFADIITDDLNTIYKDLKNVGKSS